MPELFFTPSPNEAEDRRIRREAEAGRLTRVAEGLYVDAAKVPEDVLLRNWARVVQHLVPDGVVTDRTAITARPARAGQDQDAYIFVSAPRSRIVFTLPGLRVSVRTGPGPVAGDIPYLGTHLASVPRQLLDNLAPSRARSGPARTLGAEAVEKKLASLCTTHGEAHLNHIRDEARALAGRIERELEFDTLDRMIGALLQSRDAKDLVTPEGRARAAGTPHDANCLARLTGLITFLQARAPQAIPNADTTEGRRNASAFIEAYFSNYIEGTRFAIDEAREIVFEGRIPEQRPEDGHDVLGTFMQLVDGNYRSIATIGPDEFIDEIRERHRQFMHARPSINPGIFKERPNQAGATVFVAPDLVEGTLRDGFAALRSLDDPFRRALGLHFLLSDVHPFADGNGRLSRLMMSRELLAADLSRIIVPTVFRDEYLDAQRALSRRDDPSIYVRSMEFCQKVTAACADEPLEAAIDTWARTYAFCEDGHHARLTMPDPSLEIETRDGTPAPADYWAALGRESGFFL